MALFAVCANRIAVVQKILESAKVDVLMSWRMLADNLVPVGSACAVVPGCCIEQPYRAWQDVGSTKI